MLRSEALVKRYTSGRLCVTIEISPYLWAQREIWWKATMRVLQSRLLSQNSHRQGFNIYSVTLVWKNTPSYCLGLLSHKTRRLHKSQKISTRTARPLARLLSDVKTWGGEFVGHRARVSAKPTRRGQRVDAERVLLPWLCRVGVIAKEYVGLSSRARLPAGARGSHRRGSRALIRILEHKPYRSFIN